LAEIGGPVAMVGVSVRCSWAVIVLRDGADPDGGEAGVLDVIKILLNAILAIMNFFF
jgi:hypothetical protein